MSSPAAARSLVIPALRYRDAAAAVEWLCQAFGFEKHLVVPGPGGDVAHAELTFRNGMVMLGSGHGDDAYGRYVQAPDGKSTGSIYVIIEDADAHYSQAREAGAEIVLDIKDEDYGGRGYTCRDPQGHVWTFGTYDPWQAAGSGSGT